MRARSRTLSVPAGWSFDRDIFVLYGAGAGPAVEALRASGQRNLAVVLPAGAAAPELPGDVALARSADELAAALSRIEGELPRQAVLKPVPGQALPERTARELRRRMEDTLHAMSVSRNTLEAYGRTWAEQGIGNLPAVARHPTVESLRGACAGRPAVVVSPGPSLSKNVARLAESRDGAVVITCFHALASLETAGVVPDVVVAVDPKNLDWQFGDYDLARVPALALATTCHPSLFELPAGCLFTFHTAPAIDGWTHAGLPGAPALDTGGTVAGAAFSLALLMGCDPVVLAGQDLALTGGRYYADATPDAASAVRVSEDGRSFVLARDLADPRSLAPLGKDGRTFENRPDRLREVPGYWGGMVETSSTFVRFREWFAAAAAANAGRARLFNCTEGGAYVEGMRHERLADVLGEHATEPFEAAAALEAAAAAWDRACAAAIVRARLEGYVAQTRRALELARRCRDLSRTAARHGDGLARLAKLERRLTSALAGLPFLGIVSEREIRQAQEAGSGAGTLEENLCAARRLYAVVEETGTLLLGPLERARAELSPRA